VTTARATFADLKHQPRCLIYGATAIVNLFIKLLVGGLGIRPLCVRLLHIWKEETQPCPFQGIAPVLIEL
jgi:hypothetical protein